LHVGKIEIGRIDVQTHVTAARFQPRNAADALDDAGKHQHTSWEVVAAWL
jgi:hypothetical protein